MLTITIEPSVIENFSTANVASWREMQDFFAAHLRSGDCLDDYLTGHDGARYLEAADHAFPSSKAEGDEDDALTLAIAAGTYMQVIRASIVTLQHPERRPDWDGSPRDLVLGIASCAKSLQALIPATTADDIWQHIAPVVAPLRPTIEQLVKVALNTIRAAERKSTPPFGTVLG